MVCKKAHYGENSESGDQVGDLRVSLHPRSKRETGLSDVVSSEDAITNAANNDETPERKIHCDQLYCLCDAELTMCLRRHKDGMHQDQVHPSWSHSIARKLKGWFGYR